jgi:hypothetical protein
VKSLHIAIAGAGAGGPVAALFCNCGLRPLPLLLAGMVSGQLLSPLKDIGLEPAPLGELR